MRMVEKTVEIVRCSQGHKFPVNRNKHLGEDYVICPRPGCREQVKIRRRFKFLPNPKWEEQKLHTAALRADMKRRSRREEPVPAIAVPVQLPATLYALSLAIKKREEELAAEKSSKQ